MSSLTATEAKNRFGQLLEMAQAEPVEIQKNGRTVAALISGDDYAAYQEFKRRPKVRPEIEALLQESIRERRALYQALAK
jgi:prevent-host-death family protein